MSKSTLLPTSSSQLEKRLSQTLSTISHIPIPIHLLWQAENCPAALLPWLAWSLSVDEWDENWSDEQKRHTILESIEIHRTKGTPSSIRRVLASAGYGEIDIIENTADIRYNQKGTYNGDYLHGAVDTHWATYKIILKRPISIEQAEQVKRLLANTAPVRCHLVGLSFEQASNLYNNKITHNGEYSYGVA